jgi:hypothetical protein
MTPESNQQPAPSSEGPHFTADADSSQCPAWTEIEPGRYMPRRVRGSFLGRALG